MMKHFRNSLYISVTTSLSSSALKCIEQNNRPNWIVIQVVGCIFTQWYQHPSREKVSSEHGGKTEKVNAHRCTECTYTHVHGCNHPITSNVQGQRSTCTCAIEKVQRHSEGCERKEGVLGVVAGFKANLIHSDGARPLCDHLNCILQRSLPMLDVLGLIGN